MIKYALKCSNAHIFESWFASAAAYDTLKSAGHVACVICGVQDVEKAIMAPRVSTARSKTAAPDTETPDAEKSTEIKAPSEETAKALADMRKHVEDNATYVGGNFAKEARDQHLGDVPDRPIWGQANAEEAKALIEDGVPVAPLPFIPTRKAN